MYACVILMHENKWYKILKRNKKFWVKQVGGMVGNKKKMPRKRRDLGSALEDSSLIVDYEA